LLRKVLVEAFQNKHNTLAALHSFFLNKEKNNNNSKLETLDSFSSYVKIILRRHKTSQTVLHMKTYKHRFRRNMVTLIRSKENCLLAQSFFILGPLLTIKHMPSCQRCGRVALLD